MSKFKKNDGWVSFKLPLDTDGKLREMAAETGLKMTTIVVKGIEAEYAKWKMGKEGVK